MLLNATSVIRPDTLSLLWNPACRLPPSKNNSRLVNHYVGNMNIFVFSFGAESAAFDVCVETSAIS